MENGAERMADELVQVVKCWIAGLGNLPALSGRNC